MKLRIAATVWGRLRGLLMRPRNYLGNDGALLLVPCNSIHTVGMSYPIDVAFVGSDGKVLKSEQSLPPNKFLACRHAVAVLERPAVHRGEVTCETANVDWFADGDFVNLDTLTEREVFQIMQ